MDLERLTRGHVLAAVAALALLLVMAMDWYGSTQADLAREATKTANPRGALSGEVGRAIQEDARTIIARDEKNAWQEDGTIDRILLALLLLSVALPLAAAAFRARGTRFEPPWTPAAFAAVAASLGALLVAYRIVQEPGPNALTTVKVGPVLALVLLAAVGLGSASAVQKESDGAALRRVTGPEHEPGDEL